MISGTVSPARIFFIVSMTVTPMRTGSTPRVAENLPCPSRSSVGWLPSMPTAKKSLLIVLPSCSPANAAPIAISSELP